MNDASAPASPASAQSGREPPPLIPTLNADALIERFDAVLLDAYGVLVDGDGAITGASALVDRLTAAGKPWLVVTNDAGRSAETCARRFQGFGLPIGPERIISSGMLIRTHFLEHALAGAGTVVLGPDDTHGYVREAGGEILSLDAEDDVGTRVVVVGDAGQARLIEALDAIVTIVLRRVDRDAPIDILVPNPDIIYPKRGGRFGFAGGGLGAMVEAALQLYAHDRTLPPVIRLGKPYPPIFLEALARTKTAPERTAMVGDQLATDIRGANGAGIVSVLVTSGVARMPSRALPPEIRPRWLLSGGLGSEP